MKYFIYVMIGLGVVEQVGKTTDLNVFEYFAEVIDWPVSVGSIIANERVGRFLMPAHLTKEK